MNRGIQTQNPKSGDCRHERHMCSQFRHVPPVSATPSLYFRRFPPASPLPVPAVHSTVHKIEWLSEEFIETQCYYFKQEMIKMWLQNYGEDEASAIIQ